MITFISCSVRPELAAALNDNLAKNLGVPYEFIAFDNREAGWGICKVYNDCARRAQYDYLCFLHEDVIFNNRNWGAQIVDKLSEADCGVIGFAGSLLKMDMPSGWGCTMEACRAHLIQHHNDGTATQDTVNPNNETFAQVITLDGLCLFMRKEVWREVGGFDEVRFAAFHGYDLDMTLAVAQRYKNYVSFGVDIEHLSEGSYNAEWIKATKELHQKWSPKLPMSTPEWREYAKNHDTIRDEYLMIKHTIKKQPEIINLSQSVWSFFARNWYRSRYAWLIFTKMWYKYR